MNLFDRSYSIDYCKIEENGVFQNFGDSKLEVKKDNSTKLYEVKLSKNIPKKQIIYVRTNQELSLQIEVLKTECKEVLFYLEDGVNLDLTLNFISSNQVNFWVLGDFSESVKSQVKITVNCIHNEIQSSICVRSVVQAGAIFEMTGQIVVKKNLKLIKADLVHKSLILDDISQIISKPELLVESKEVVCTHGSSVSFLEDTTLEYLLSRGLDTEIAKNLLKSGFFTLENSID